MSDVPLVATYKDMYEVVHVVVYSRYNDSYFVRCSSYGAVAKVTKDRVEQVVPTCVMCCGLT